MATKVSKTVVESTIKCLASYYAAGPGTCARIETGFGVDADELLFEREGLRISGLKRIHGDKSEQNRSGINN
jgi:hypothetical protein